MRISAMNVKITLQKHVIFADEIGNHRNMWMDDFSCYATTSTMINDVETESAAQTVNRERLDFTVRYSSKSKDVRANTHRIVFDDRTYNIISVDDMGFKHKSLKFHGELVKNNENSIN